MNKKEVKKAPALRFKGFTNDWEERKLGDFIDVKSGKDYKHLNSGSIPVYGTGGYMLSVDRALSDIDAIGIGRKGTIDKPYLLKAPFWTVDTLFYAVPKQNIDLQFSLSIFKKINWKKFDESTGVPSLSKTVINSVGASVPSYEEQQKIGSFFKQLDKTIALHQRKLESFQFTYHEIIRRLFLKKAKWQLTKLSDLVTILDKNRKPVKKEDRLLGDTPYYGANGIQDYISGFTHKGEFILIAEDGANSLTEYPIYFVKGQIWVNNHAHVLKVNRDVSPLFLALALKQINYSKYTVGSSRNKLNLKDLENIAIFIPDNNEQQKIGQFYSNYLNYLRINKKRIQYMKQFKQFLLQNMFI
ncbi:Type I restriction-modification system specificity subunit [Lactobacillus helveticus DPC 4571]|uniref:Type I restriction-modification system specificity subunit n=1 Tax=Lactobacillus helveticus (strain DPC 4571) TaxID=405566 RepID=A8YVB5_LACH4|nr:restriction endonuclease subunit S [Lactobacillus helveticus]ABX27202.1 Type I restriction-modification system specificity subunit [Lactobacillus helveticus DPC 4571]NHL85673.1 restriction endonuclease subunit S [Lactobacillus helveticus]